MKLLFLQMIADQTEDVRTYARQQLVLVASQGEQRYVSMIHSNLVEHLKPEHGKDAPIRAMEAMPYFVPYDDTGGLEKIINDIAKTSSKPGGVSAALRGAAIIAQQIVGQKKRLDPDEAMLGVSTISEPDSVASSAAPGGIDFNPANLNLQEEGGTIVFDLSAELQNMPLGPVDGARPVITSIIPVEEFSALLASSK